MPEYRRLRIPGGTYFFTVVTHERRPFLCHEASRRALHNAISETRVRYQFETIAWVLLPDHLHCIWKLPENDSGYATRWRLIKTRFSREIADAHGNLDAPNPSRIKRSERHIWQRRFWEHCIRDQDDLNHHIDYVHFNPVKHGLVQEPKQWPYSTYHRWARAGGGVLKRPIDEREIMEMECE